MKFLKRPQLVLILSAFVTVFCRCSLTPGTPVTLALVDGNSIECLEFFENEPTFSNLSNSIYTYDCSIPCPDGSQVSINAMRLPNRTGKYGEGEIVDLDLITLQSQYCMAATPTPTSTPLAEDPSAPVQVAVPLLTERVTACDYKAGFVNFELADPARDYTSMQMQIALNDTQTECNIPNSNKDILSCNLPANIRFPINIQAQVDNVEVNNFNFDGSYCGYKDSTGSGAGTGDSGAGDSGSNNPSDPDVVPTPTDFGG